MGWDHDIGDYTCHVTGRDQIFRVTSCDQTWAEPGPDWGVRRDDPSLHRATVLHIHTRRWVRALGTERGHFTRDILLFDIDTVMNTQNSQFKDYFSMAHEIIVSIFRDAYTLYAHCYWQADWLSKFLPSPKYCITVSISMSKLKNSTGHGRMLCNLHSDLNMISCLDRGCKMPQEK